MAAALLAGADYYSDPHAALLVGEAPSPRRPSAGVTALASGTGGKIQVTSGEQRNPTWQAPRIAFTFAAALLPSLHPCQTFPAVPPRAVPVGPARGDGSGSRVIRQSSDGGAGRPQLFSDGGRSRARNCLCDGSPASPVAQAVTHLGARPCPQPLPGPRSGQYHQG